MAVVVRQEGAGFSVRYGFRTAAGAVIRDLDEMDGDDIERMVMQTLGRGTSVWVHGPKRIMDALLTAAGARRIATGGRVPTVVAGGDPFAAFQAPYRRRIPVEGTVMSFCRYELVDGAEPLEHGAFVSMKATSRPDATRIAYLGPDGRELGLHGVVPRELSRSAILEIDAVRVPLERYSLGRTGTGEEGEAEEGNLHQILIFSIPARVDAMLQDARIPGRGRQKDSIEPNPCPE